MAGLISLQQGPFGVAASARRPVQRPGEKSRLRVSELDGARIGPDLPEHSLPDGPAPEDAEDFQASAPMVSSRTLFDASLIVSALPPGEGVLAPPPAPRNADWQPPASTLRLRDRSV